MAAGMPAGSKLEIEFTPGVWTDVTADMEPDPLTIKVGRTSEFSAPSVGTLDGIRLNNATGRYSPLCQVLVDGTPSPYWPNVLPRKRIRYSNTPMGTRFVGNIKGWPPFVDADGRAWVVMTGTDALDQPLSRVTLKSPIDQEVHDSAPAASWAMTEPADSTVAIEGSGGPPLMLTNEGPALVFGDNGPGIGDGTGVKFAPSAADTGQYLAAQVNPTLQLSAFTIECWVNAGASLPAWNGGTGVNIVGFGDLYCGFLRLVDGKPWFYDGFCQVTAAASIVDNGWHHIAVTRPAPMAPVTLYVDGVSQGDSVDASAPGSDIKRVTVGEGILTVFLPSRYQGNIGRVGIYTTALTPAQIAAHAAATNGYWGERTDQRIARWLTCAGLTSADWNLDAGLAVVGTYPQAGKDVVSACQDMAVTEGAGSVFYVTPDGKARFENRVFRKPAAPVLTLDAEADLDGNVYAPSFDELTLVNSCTGNRAASSGTLTTQTFTDQVSVARYGLTDDGSGVTSYATTDLDVMSLTQARVARNAYPGFRLPQVGVDLVTAQNNCYAAVASVRIGSRIRVTNLPKAQGPATQIDVIVEGWTETASPDTYKVVFDTAPADNPARGVYDDTTYGRYQCSGQTLNAALTNSATTVVIATGAGLPTFTTAGARYPLKIQVGQEIITLNTAPGGSASPQTFTGATRAAAGTSAAAQASGAPVNIWPQATYTL